MDVAGRRSVMPWAALTVFVLCACSPTGMSDPSSFPPLPGSAQPTPTLTLGYRVTIGAGLTPTLPAEAVAGWALANIAGMERKLGRAIATPEILTVEYTTVGRLPPRIQEGRSDERGGGIWVVTARGTFVPFFGDATISADNGYWLLDDLGHPIGSGFPIPPELLP